MNGQTNRLSDKLTLPTSDQIYELIFIRYTSATRKKLSGAFKICVLPFLDELPNFKSYWCTD